MPVKESFTLEKAKEIIDYALTEFYLHDKALVQYPSIKEAVSENCMLFRIGWYMHEYVKRDGNFALLSVDCQYNRNFEHPKSMYKQTLSEINKKVKDPICFDISSTNQKVEIFFTTNRFIDHGNSENKSKNWPKPHRFSPFPVLFRQYYPLFSRSAA